MKKIFLSILLLFALSSCNYVATKTGYQKVEDARVEIEKIKQAGAIAIEKKEEEIKGKLSEVIDKQIIQLQSAANSLHGASLTRPLYEKETRVMLITFNRIEEAKAALGVGPTLEAMKFEQDRLIKELDEKQTSLADLKKTHDDVIREKEGLVAEVKLTKEQVAKLEKEKVDIQNSSKDQIILEQNKLSNLQDTLLDAEGVKKKQQEYIESNKRLLMISLGVLSIVGLVIALYLPLFKKQAFTFSSITGAGAILIPFVQPLHFFIVFTLALLIGLYFIFRKVGIISQSSANAFNAIQDYKDKEPEKYESLRPILEEYNKKYVGGDKVEKVEDKAVTSYIKEVLKDYEKI